MNRTAKVLVSCKVFFCLAFLAAIAGSASASNITWDNGSGDRDWNNGFNWIGHDVPGTGNNQYARINMATGPVFIDGRTATAYRVYLEGSNGTLTMNGGTLNTDNHIYVAAAATDTATLNMSGGVINIAGTFYVAQFTGGNGTINLSGGTISCGILSMRNLGGTGTINITGTGTLIFTSTYNNIPVTTWIANGWIKAYNGAGTVYFDYDITTPGKTTVWTNRKAVNPSPANNAVDVAVNVNLGWTAGPGAVSHDVYFGTVFTDVNTAERLLGDLDGNGNVDFKDILQLTEYWLLNPAGSEPYVGLNDDNIVDFNDYALLAEDWKNNANPVFKGNQGTNSFNPGMLALNTTYYWRIDEVNGPSTTKGEIWSFTTASGKAFSPSPVDDATYVALDAPLNWSAGAGATSHNVYFGTADPPPSIGNQTAATYNPGTLAQSTTYYWRIDEVGSFGTIQGDVWSFTTIDDSYSLYGKIMCGYQGWFACPGDGSGRSWAHWANGAPFDYTNLKIEMWPDISEYANTYVTGFTLGNPPYSVFSSYDTNTTMVHFKWMQQYGIDGVFVQRFGSDFGVKSFLNTVLSNCKTAANAYGRRYAVMYDLTGYTTSSLVSNITSDWMDLENNLGITTDPLDESYITHNSKPVIAIYGIFGTGVSNYPDPGLCATLIEWFKDRGFTVMIGVNNDWRTRTSDTNFQLCVSKADIIMPWNVGRYGTTAEVVNKANGLWTDDLNWCNTNNKNYSVCIFPGFSWHNWHTGSFNQIPRNGGQFLWDQVYNAKRIGANMIYVAMFDEVDEGTAIFKVSNNPPPASGGIRFVTLDVDGYPLPTDEYLWLVGQASRGLRSEIPVNATRPVRP